MNNKIKTAIAGALLSTGFAMATPASAEMYANAQLAVSEIGYSNTATAFGYSGFDNGLTLVGTIGMPLPTLHQYIGWEAEIAKSIVNPESSYTTVTSNYTVDYDYYNVGGYAVFTYPVHDMIDIRARAGLVYHNFEVTSSVCFFGGGCTAYRVSDSDINPSISGGALYKISPNLNLMAELTVIDVDNDSFHLSAGAQFKF